MAANTKTIRRSLASLELSPNEVPALVTYSQGIVKAMTGNAAFPSDGPALAAVTAAVSDLQTAETAVLARTKGAVANQVRSSIGGSDGDHATNHQGRRQDPPSVSSR
jgi:hypothetical protein